MKLMYTMGLIAGVCIGWVFGERFGILTGVNAVYGSAYSSILNRLKRAFSLHFPE
jgi:hypothetical protein